MDVCFGVELWWHHKIGEDSFGEYPARYDVSTLADFGDKMDITRQFPHVRIPTCSALKYDYKLK